MHGTVASSHGKINRGPRVCNWIWDTDDDELHQLVKDSFTTESFGIKVMDNKPHSREDRHAQTILNQPMCTDHAQSMPQNALEIDSKQDF